MTKIFGFLSVFLLLLSLLIPSVLAEKEMTNRDELLNAIKGLSNNFEVLKSEKRNSLEEKVFNLSNNFDESFSNLKYDQRTIDYLTSMGKITSNFKRDLTKEYNLLYSEIGSKINGEINSLSSLRNNITINYSTVSNSQKDEFLIDIQRFETNYIDLESEFKQKIQNLNNKYSTNLNSYKDNLHNVIENNITSVELLDEFSNTFNSLKELHESFQKNYKTFSDKYLTYAGELTGYASKKEKEYIEEFSKRLDRLVETNIEANPRLEDYLADINRLKRILVDNFSNSLNMHLRDNFGLLYSEADLNSVINNFNNAKNKYYDASNNLRTGEVLSNTGVLSQINTIQTNLSNVNSRLENIISDDQDLNTLSNIKIRLENIIIRFYNESYPQYREDILSKLREKMNLISLETRNIVTISEIIDIRYTMLSDNITSSNNIEDIKRQINNFKSFTNKYLSLNDASLNNKIHRLSNSLNTYVVDRKLSTGEFRQFINLREGLEGEIMTILEKIENKFPDSYNNKFDIVLSRIEAALNLNIDNKTKHMLLMVEKSIYKYLSDK